MGSEAKGVLFDIDGTLADTNYLHAIAWWRAFRDHGHFFPTSRIHRLVGMGADQFLEQLIGRQDDALIEAHARHYEELKPEVRAFPGAPDLLKAVSGMGLKVVLASSAGEGDLDVLLKALDSDDVIATVVSAKDVDRTKPEPDIFSVAMSKSNLTADTCLALGDTPWDVSASAKCGVGCLGVTTGGWGRGELEAAGALAVYSDVEDLHEHLAESPIGLLGGA